MPRKPASRVLSALEQHLGRRRPEEIRFAVEKSSLGFVLLALGEDGVVSILVGGDEARLVRILQTRFTKAKLTGGDGEARTFARRVADAIEDPMQQPDLPLDLRGTVFQKRVWQAVREIPPGKTSTYAAVAQAIGAPKAVRAVGAACSANLFAFVIPCHRVLRSDGSPSGGAYWSEGRRQVLLEREAAAARRRTR